MASTRRRVGDILSELARDNYRGLIDPHTYRLQRAALLDDLVADEDDDEAASTTRPQAPARDRRAGNPPLSDPANQRRRDVDRVREQVATADVLEIVDAAKEQARAAAMAAALPAATTATRPKQEAEQPAAPPPAPAPAASASRSRWPLVAAGVVITVALVAGLIAMLGGGDTPPDSQSTAGDRIEQQPGEKLIDDFVATDNWSEASVLALTENWQHLLPSQRQQALDSTVFRSFAHDVRRRLLESAALRELGGGETERDNALVALATAMNFQVPLPDTDIAPLVDLPPASVNRQVVDAATKDDASAVTVVPPVELSGALAEPQPSPVSPVKVVQDKPVAKPPAAAVTPPPPPPPATVAAQPKPKPQTDPAPADEAPGAAGSPQVTAARDSGCFAGLLKTRQRSCSDTLVNGDDGPRMAIVKPASFTMGSDWAPEEQPPHQVTLNKPFAIAVHEISHEEYLRYCRDTGTPCPANPWDAGDYPAVGVSWPEAAAYARWLSEQTGRNYRLPSEAEWEFAARAGVQSRYPFGDELLPVQARFASARDSGSPWARSYRDAPRNAFGLYNSIGNVREWVADVWHDSHAGAPADGSVRTGNATAARVVRGGSYADDAAALRLSSRARLDANAKDERTGFRVAVDF